MEAFHGLMAGLGIIMTPANLYYCLIGSIVLFTIVVGYYIWLALL